jgi:hypothetical protein
MRRIATEIQRKGRLEQDGSSANATQLDNLDDVRDRECEGGCEVRKNYWTGRRTLMENQLMELVVCHMAKLMLYKSIMA